MKMDGNKITYYTSRRKDIYANRGEADQWVYILSNPTLPNILKNRLHKK